MTKEQLTQADVDALLKPPKPRRAGGGNRPPTFDFSRPDRIAATQLHALGLMHESFARNVSAALSAYLRDYLTVKLTSVEQLNYGEFTDGLSVPSSLMSVGMAPYAASAVIEMGQQIAFAMLEILLGGRSRERVRVKKEVTDIEQSLIEVLYRIVLHDLRETWRPVVPLEFSVEKMAWEPRTMRIFGPQDPVVAVSFEIRLGDVSGTMNIAYPSVAMRSIVQRFDRDWTRVKTEPTEDDQRRMLELVKRCRVELDTRLAGLKLKVRDLLEIEEGDILQLDYAVGRPVECTMNGLAKFTGRLAGSRAKKAMVIESMPEA